MLRTIEVLRTVEMSLCIKVVVLASSLSRLSGLSRFPSPVFLVFSIETLKDNIVKDGLDKLPCLRLRVIQYSRMFKIK